MAVVASTSKQRSRKSRTQVPGEINPLHCRRVVSGCCKQGQRTSCVGVLQPWAEMLRSLGDRAATASGWCCNGVLGPRQRALVPQTMTVNTRNGNHRYCDRRQGICEQRHVLRRAASRGAESQRVTKWLTTAQNEDIIYSNKESKHIVFQWGKQSDYN
jgi:hypothetical protein